MKSPELTLSSPRRDTSVRGWSCCFILIASFFHWQCFAATNVFSFTYANRTALLNAGWNFIATDPSGQPRNTEITNSANGAVISYDQTGHPGTLRIPVDTGDVWGGANNTRNSLFHALNTNWMSIQLNATFHPTVDYQQVQLSLYQDDDNWVQIGHVVNDSVGGEVVGMSREAGGVHASWSPLTLGYGAITSNRLWFRLERNLTNDLVSGFYSVDGTNFTRIGTTSLVLTNAKVCIWAGGSPGGFPNCDLRDLTVVQNDLPLPPLLVAQPQQLVFNSVEGRACTNLQQVHLITRRVPAATNCTVASNVPWLRPRLFTNSAPGSADVGVDTTGLLQGVYSGQVTFSAPGASSTLVSVSLIVNPAIRASVATWRGGKSGAMTVWVDDNQPTAFDDLSTNGLAGTYLLIGGGGFPAFFPSYYAAGMELASHTMDHPCAILDEGSLRYEMESNTVAIAALNLAARARLTTFAWPCGFLGSFVDEVVAADYYLCARGYNLNQLEDPSPYDWMNLKSFNSHEHTPFPPADLKTLVDAAISQGKWFNLVLHTTNNSDGAIAYSVGKDIWAAPAGAISRYCYQRDRTVITNYSESPGLIAFNCFRFALGTSPSVNFESSVGPDDLLTMQVDVSGAGQIYGLSLNGSGIPYSTATVNSRQYVRFDLLMGTNIQAVALTTSTNSSPSLQPQADQSIAEGSTLLLTNIATDVDLGVQTLSYSLLDEPLGAAIDSNGVFAWTPSEAQGPGTYTITVVATDSGVPALSATNSFSVFVTELNSPPVLPAQPDVNFEGPTPVTIINAASDPDLPTNPLTYQLLVGPQNASIDNNGIIHWIPTIDQVPSTNVFTSVVTDFNAAASVSQSLSATNSFVVRVSMPSFPFLAPGTNVTLVEGQAMIVTNAALEAGAVGQWVTNSFVFNYPNRGAFLADGWNFVATTGTGQPRNTEITSVADGAVANYDQSAHPGVLRIPCDLGDLWAGLNNSRNQLFRNLPSGWKSVRCSFDFAPTLEFQQAHLGLYQDDDNYVQAGIAFNNNLGGQAVTVINEDNAVPNHAFLTVSGVTNIQLRLDRLDDNGTLACYYGLTSSNWSLIAITNQALNNPRIGFWTGGSPVAWTNGLLNADLRRFDILSSNLAPTVVTYSLQNPPAGATVDGNGVIRWTPGEYQGPSTNLITMIATDNAVPPRSSTNSFTVVVQEWNQAPVLPFQTNVTINELSTLTINNSASPPTITNNFLFSYNSRDALLADGWSFAATRGNGTARNTETTSGLVVSYDQLAHPGTLRIPCDIGDLWDGQNNNRNMLVHTLSSNWMSMQFSFSFAPTANYQQVSLGVYQDDENYTELSYVYNSGRKVAFSQEINASPSTAFITGVTGTNVTLRFERDLITSQLSGMYSMDGTNWNTLGRIDQHVTNPRVVIWAGSTLSGNPNADFRSLTIVETNSVPGDADYPPNSMTYVLAEAPSGATIDGAGIIRWVPSEAQGPSTNVFTSVVTDYNPWAVNEQHLSCTNSFVVVVNEINSSPVFPAQLDLFVNVNEAITVTNTAADSDLPANALSYALLQAPAGAVIDPNGIITWPGAPTAQAGSSNLFVTLVSDSNPWAVNASTLRATNSFVVYVNSIHNGPLLPLQSDVTIPELTPLIITNTAADADIPQLALSYALVVPPLGASIDTNGIITWLPSEAQGPSTNLITTVVTDNGVPPFSYTNSFLVIVEEVNIAPVLPQLATITMPVTNTVIVPNSASDVDIPANTLNYSLVLAPTGAVIDAQGLITWTNAAKQVPSTNTFQTVVTDDNPWAINSAHLSATNTFQVILLPVHNGPVLPGQANVTVQELATLLITNTASSSDIPALNFSYALINPPQGATIDTNGVISWTPTEAEGPGTNEIVTLVTDSGNPPFSATNSFLVAVQEVNSPPVLSTVPDLLLSGAHQVTVTNAATDSDLPQNELAYTFNQAPTGATVDAQGIISWLPASGQVPSTNVFETVVTDDNPWAINDQHLRTTNRFTVILQSPVVPFNINSINFSNGAVTITWASMTGQTYRVQYADGLASPWQDVSPDIIATGAETQYTEPVNSGSQRFYRVLIPNTR